MNTRNAKKEINIARWTLKITIRRRKRKIELNKFVIMIIRERKTNWTRKRKINWTRRVPRRKKTTAKNMNKGAYS